MGDNRGVKPTVSMRKHSAAAHQQRASARADDLAPTITELQADGATSSYVNETHVLKVLGEDGSKIELEQPECTMRDPSRPAGAHRIVPVG